MKDYTTVEGVEYTVYNAGEVTSNILSKAIENSTYYDSHYVYAKEEMRRQRKIARAKMRMKNNKCKKTIASMCASFTVPVNYISSIRCGFDIETTKVVDRDEEGNINDARSYMYHWQFSVNDIIVVGRKWDEFQTFFETFTDCVHEELKKAMHRNKERFTEKKHPNVIIWIANLPFEFQFIKDRINWNNVFAKDTRKALNASIFTKGKKAGEGFSYIRFQDCLQVSNSNLDSLAKDYCTTHKRKGDLDYTIPRNSQTPLTEAELHYCYDDVAVLSEWHKYYYNTYSVQHYAPMTATGVLRHEVKKRQTVNDLNKVYEMLPTMSEYNYVMSWLFKGGYAHANMQNVNLEFNNEVYSWDITSSYPYVMLNYKFPMSKFFEYKQLEDILNDLGKDPEGLYKFIEGLQGQAMFYCNVEIFTPKAKTKNTYISLSKCMNYDEIVRYENELADDNFACTLLDNGRIYRTLRTLTAETDVDILTILEMYSYSEIRFSKVMVCDKIDYLPKYVTEPIENAYEVKCRLKKEGKSGTIEYKVAKALVNAGYGMMCTRLVVQEITYFQEERRWGVVEDKPVDTQPSKSGSFKRIASKKKDPEQEMLEDQLFLNPMWGVWVTAYARRRLMQMVIKAGNNTIVCDTDSIYAKKSTELMQFIEDLNKEVEAGNKKRFNNPLFDDLGTWDKQSVNDNKEFVPYERFASMGAKRYILYGWNDGKYGWKQTIAGLPKKTIINFCEKYNEAENKKDVDKIGFYKGKETIDPMDVFLGMGGLELSPEMNTSRNSKSQSVINMTEEHAGKNTTVYHDTDHSDYITDNNGVTEYMTEKSSVTIIPISFRMTIAGQFLVAISWCASRMENSKKERRLFG